MAFRLLDHTADVMVEVSAPSPEELFEEAARALFHILTSLQAVVPRQRVPITVEADAIEPLLVSWLNELLFLHEVHQWMFGRFEILCLEPKVVRAAAWGEKFDAGRHTIEREVKAVTYHRLRLIREGGEVKTTIVFDL